jgi:hypothetical protein
MGHHSYSPSLLNAESGTDTPQSTAAPKSLRSQSSRGSTLGADGAGPSTENLMPSSARKERAPSGTSASPVERLLNENRPASDPNALRSDAGSGKANDDHGGILADQPRFNNPSKPYVLRRSALTRCA